jgi:acyl-CoA synthetase (NDP forming)
VPELPREAQEELRRLLFPIAAVSKPIDLTGGGVDEHFGVTLEVGLKYASSPLKALYTPTQLGPSTLTPYFLATLTNSSSRSLRPHLGEAA